MGNKQRQFKPVKLLFPMEQGRGILDMETMEFPDSGFVVVDLAEIACIQAEPDQNFTMVVLKSGHCCNWLLESVEDLTTRLANTIANWEDYYGEDGGWA